MQKAVFALYKRDWKKLNKISSSQPFGTLGIALMVYQYLHSELAEKGSQLYCQGETLTRD